MTPRLSVIVPVYQGESLLPITLGALAASDLPRSEWELIVVDDASTDATAETARSWADQVVSLDGGPSGPAYARNRGAEVSRGEWLVFVDADVQVHPDTLRRIVEAIDGNSWADALFGLYDEMPPGPNFLSQYRNLLHRYTHMAGAGEVDTFWAGCGAVRRSAFEAVRGYDEQRFPRPQIEDIELGYRIRDNGGRIALCPEVQGTHLKIWTAYGSVRTDLLDRGIPWARLLLARRKLLRPNPLQLKPGEPAKAVTVAIGMVLFVAGVLLGNGGLAVAGLFAWLAVVVANRDLFRWFSDLRGPLFAVRAVPWHLIYYLISGAAVAVSLLMSLRGGAGRSPSLPSLRMVGVSTSGLYCGREPRAGIESPGGPAHPQPSEVV